MSKQMKLTSYFGKRKRIGGDEFYVKSKKILLDGDGTSPLFNHVINIDTHKGKCMNEDGTGGKIEAKEFVNYSKTDEDKASTLTGSDVEKLTESNIIENQAIGNLNNKLKPECSNSCVAPVVFQKLGTLSPAKKKNLLPESGKEIPVHLDKVPEARPPSVSSSSVPSASKDGNVSKDKSKAKCFTDNLKSAKELLKRIKESQKKTTNAEQPNKKNELSLKEVKDKLKQSAKLNELKKSINKINEQVAELTEIENRKKESSVPKLSKFKAIEVDVPLSPQKNALYSPSKVERSPGKPAFERFNFLAEANTSLPLPCSFQKLYELFRAVDTISSMMINRGEDITFNKLKPAVQEMTRKTFTLRHLSQIAAVLPSAFNFSQEKVRNFGSTSKTDRYELVIKPTFPENSQGRSVESGGLLDQSSRMSMTPKIIKARREAFYNSLLDKTKDCHEEFLKSLDPPMEINRNDLKRWHPNFMVDHVPDIIPRELPQPLGSERPATAKEVLERAKDFLSSNSRLQKALESASQSNDDESKDITSRVSPEIKDKVNSRLRNPLKGISKSLLERVRARQAAKALDSMRMTPEQEKETVMYTRLPAIARIVRTLFVNEQRGVLSWEIVLEKVQFSYNRNLGKGEAESHVKLLVELLPEWLSIVHIRNGNYLKMNPAAELALVMSKLDKIASEKAKNS